MLTLLTKVFCFFWRAWFEVKFWAVFAVSAVAFRLAMIRLQTKIWHLRALIWLDSRGKPKAPPRPVVSVEETRQSVEETRQRLIADCERDIADPNTPEELREFDRDFLRVLLASPTK